MPHRYFGLHSKNFLQGQWRKEVLKRNLDGPAGMGLDGEVGKRNTSSCTFNTLRFYHQLSLLLSQAKLTLSI